MGRRCITVSLGSMPSLTSSHGSRRSLTVKTLGGVTTTTDSARRRRLPLLPPRSVSSGKDKWGNWVVNKKYNAAQLAEAMCKLHGFRYEPSPDVFWQQGRSTENDFLYVTTQTLLHEQLATLSAEVGLQRSLLVVCNAYRGKADTFPNLTVKRFRPRCSRAASGGGTTTASTWPM